MIGQQVLDDVGHLRERDQEGRPLWVRWFSNWHGEEEYVNLAKCDMSASDDNLASGDDQAKRAELVSMSARQAARNE